MLQGVAGGRSSCNRSISCHPVCLQQSPLCHSEEQSDEESENINVHALRSFTSFRITISKYAKAKIKNAFTFPPILQQLCPNSSSRIKNLSSTFVAVYYLLFHVIQQREESENIKLAGTSRGATAPATLYTLSTS